MENKLTKHECEQYHISTQDHSWNTFTISPIGDLFIHGDWGYYCYNWRSAGDNFKEFLVSINSEYFLAKIESNISLHQKKKITPTQKQKLILFFEEFQKILKQELTVKV
jgi:hypothetical protein